METTQQASTMQAKPQKQHQWLQKLIGEWTAETETFMGADHPVEKATGTETVRSLGELWVLAEGQGGILPEFVRPVLCYSLRQEREHSAVLCNNPSWSVE